MNGHGIIIPREVCQECQLCCRFLEPDRMTPFSSRPDLLPILPPSFTGISPPTLLPVLHEGFTLWQCSHLDPRETTCRIWPEHPLDCRIYPLMFVRIDDNDWIGIDTNCPYASRIPREQLLEQANRLREREWKELSPTARRELSRQLAHEMSEGVLPLLPL